MIDPRLDAHSYASVAHAGQKYGERPYIVHPEAVRAVLVEHGISDPDLLDAALLHDTVEDTEVSVSDLGAAFGLRVAALVSAVTDKPGATRRMRHVATYPLLPATEGAVLVKLADRISSVRECAESGDRRLKMYRKEQEYFAATLYGLDPRAAELQSTLSALLEVV